LAQSHINLTNLSNDRQIPPVTSFTPKSTKRAAHHFHSHFHSQHPSQINILTQPKSTLHSNIFLLRYTHFMLPHYLTLLNSTHPLLSHTSSSNTTKNRTEQNRTEQNRTEQNRTEQNRTENIHPTQPTVTMTRGGRVITKTLTNYKGYRGYRYNQRASSTR
jgi:hypothetical protein